jgi:hypothetical protein
MCSIAMHDSDETDAQFHSYWHIWVCFQKWQPQSLNPILTEVADNTISNVILVDLAQQILYHPYDGGADIVLPNAAERDHWKS